MGRPRKQRRNPHGSAWHWKQNDCWYYTLPGTKKRIPLFTEDGNRFAERAEAIARLATWRESVGDAFPSRFPVTLAGTDRWLKQNLLEVPDRLLLLLLLLLFWILDRTGQHIGHLGLFRFDYAERHAERDNAIRGVPQILPGIMEGSVRALAERFFTTMEWSQACWRRRSRRWVAEQTHLVRAAKVGCCCASREFSGLFPAPRGLVIPVELPPLATRCQPKSRSTQLSAEKLR